MSNFFDAYLTTTPQTTHDAEILKKAHAFRINPRNIHRKRREFLFLPVGCPRVATCRRAVKKHACEQDSLLYAPTNYNWFYEGEIRSHMVRDYGIKIIGDLLENFPEYRIVFRPCATTWTHDYTKNLIAAHQGHPRFAVSRDFDHAPEFARAAVLLTDYSNIGEVFALATLRPEIRMQQEYAYEKPKLMRTGFLANHEGDVMGTVRTALAQTPDFWKEHITASYNSYIFDPEQTFSRIRKALLAITKKILPHGAVAIPRAWNQPPWTEMDYLKNMFWKQGVDEELIKNFMKDFPDDPVPLSIYLCIMHRKSPLYHIPEQILRRIKETISLKLDQGTTFASITKEHGLLVLQAGRLRALRRKDTVYAAGVTALLENFEALWIPSFAPFNC